MKLIAVGCVALGPASTRRKQSRRLICVSIVFVIALNSSTFAQEKPGTKGTSKPIAKNPEQNEKLSEAIRLGLLQVKLQPMKPKGRPSGPRWSPKGTKVALKRNAEELAGKIAIGKAATFAVRWQLAEPGDDAVFSIDLNGDGKFSPKETSTIKATERRGSFWYSGEQVLKLPMKGGGTRPYPISLWYVIGSEQDPEEPQVMRWTRRGWMEGTFKLGDKPAVVVMTEGLADGTYTAADSWGLGFDQDAAYRNAMARLNKHSWLNGVAFRPVKFDPEGQSISFEAFDPGFTEAEERERNDPYAADKKLARAKQPVKFETDFKAALETAGKENRLVFVDFVTTWCGPCKMMDRYVYTAKPVVDRLKQFVSVQLDGDEEQEIVEKYKIEGYPTLLVLDAKGKVLAKSNGYTQAAKLLKFLEVSE